MPSLSQSELLHDPFKQFARWFRDANRSKKVACPEAMCLSTIDREDFPDARMVLLKEHDDAGFVFYTNTRSIKAQSLAKIAKAALTFYWEPLQRQVRIQGITQPVSSQEADAYFRTRPRLAQIGAWASRQSDVLNDRATLERRFDKFVRRFRGKPVPRPPYWGGYRLIPSKFEFWQGGPYRLHDRFLFVKKRKRWQIRRLYP